MVMGREMAEQAKGITMLNLKQVEQRVGYGKTTIYKWLKPESSEYKPHFPKPSKKGKNLWVDSAIDEFCIIEYGDSVNPQTDEGMRKANKPNQIVSALPILQTDVIDTKDISISSGSTPAKLVAVTLSPHDRLRRHV
jgi:predicted DNA-binding transcriptional regulator AlpA